MDDTIQWSWNKMNSQWASRIDKVRLFWTGRGTTLKKRHIYKISIASIKLWFGLISLKFPQFRTTIPPEHKMANQSIVSGKFLSKIWLELKLDVKFFHFLKDMANPGYHSDAESATYSRAPSQYTISGNQGGVLNTSYISFDLLNNVNLPVVKTRYDVKSLSGSSLYGSKVSMRLVVSVFKGSRVMGVPRL